MEFLLLMLVLFAAKGGERAPLGEIAGLLKSEPLKDLRVGSMTAGELADAAERFSALAGEGGLLRRFAEGKADFAGLGALAQLFAQGMPAPLPAPACNGGESPPPAPHAACNPLAPIAPFAPAEFVCALNRCFA